ncbi:MAG: site-specific integrase [Clostridia bacterium]|nr:site-specific integrase [Clostridia bacterium]
MPNYEQNPKSKKWSVRFRTIIDGIEKQKRLSGFRTKKEAQTGYISFISEQEKIEKLRMMSESPADITFSELITKYLSYMENRVKYSSLYSQKHKIDKHILPYFNDRPVKEIKPLDIMEWQENLKEYSFAYKKGLRGLLNAIYKFGYRYYDIPNIVQKVEPFRNLEPKKEIQYWSLDEFRIFIECVDKIEYKTLFSTLYNTGCRIGEALALTWNDIDLNKQKITINKSMTKKAKNKPFEITTPKNMSSNRIIDISKKLTEQLASYKKWQKENHQDTSFVFGGNRPFPKTTMERVFNEAIKKSEVRKITIHGFRHSCASLLISQGASIVAVSKRLGHKNIEQTLNTYSHMLPDDVSKIISILEQI